MQLITTVGIAEKLSANMKHHQFKSICYAGMTWSSAIILREIHTGQNSAFLTDTGQLDTVDVIYVSFPSSIFDSLVTR